MALPPSYLVRHEVVSFRKGNIQGSSRVVHGLMVGSEAHDVRHDGLQE